MCCWICALQKEQQAKKQMINEYFMILLFFLFGSYESFVLYESVELQCHTLCIGPEKTFENNITIVAHAIA